MSDFEGILLFSEVLQCSCTSLLLCRLCYRTIVPVCYHATVFCYLLLSGWTTGLLYDRTIVLLYHCYYQLLYYCANIHLHYCTIVTMKDCTILLLCQCTCVALHGTAGSGEHPGIKARRQLLVGGPLPLNPVQH